MLISTNIKCAYKKIKGMQKIQIEKIRDHMCSIGNFEKSRVSNKTIKE